MGFQDRLFSIFGVTVSYGECLKKHSTFNVGGTSDYFVTVYSVKSLIEVVKACKEYDVPYKIIGNGTNLLFSDKGFRGAIVSLKGLTSLRFSDGIVLAMAGVNLCDLVLFSAEYQLFGGEQLAGIPATVGGAVVMNAGAFGKTISDFIQHVTTIKDGKIITYQKEQCDFSYRHSRFLGANEPIVWVTFQFDKGKKDDAYVQEVITKCKQIRKENQPTGRSCGSVFKNPDGDYAGRLIESAGLKGFSIGGATVSQKHANFIIADKDATASDVYSLIKYVKEKVKQRYGIILCEEVEFVGEF